MNRDLPKDEVENPSLKPSEITSGCTDHAVSVPRFFWNPESLIVEIRRKDIPGEDELRETKHLRKTVERRDLRERRLHELMEEGEGRAFASLSKMLGSDRSE